MTDAELAAAVDRLLDQREAQGMPRRVEDPATLRRVAAIIRNSPTWPRATSEEATA